MPNVHRLGFGFRESEKVLLRALERFVRALQLTKTQQASMYGIG